MEAAGPPLRVSGTARNVACKDVGRQKHKCFRCGNPRFAGGKFKFPERGRNALGHPTVVPPRGNPTHRRPRQAPQAAPVTPNVIEEGGMLGCNAQLLFEFLRQMGLQEEVMKQVQSKVQPRVKEVSKEKAFSLARARLDQVTAQKAKLERTLKYHMEKVREFEDALLDKQRKVDEATEHFREKSKYRFSPTLSVVPEDAHSAEHVSSDGMSHSDGQGDEDSEGGDGANVPQGTMLAPPKGDVLCLSWKVLFPVVFPLSMCWHRVSRFIPKMISIGLKRFLRRNSTMKPQTVSFER